MTMLANATLLDEMTVFVGVVDERLAALQLQLEPEAPVGATAPAPMSEALAEGVCVDLARQVQRHADRVLLDRELPAEVVAEFRYMLAAWADETLIRRFRERLPRAFVGAVEQHLFGTMDAGEQVFIKIERALARRSYDDLCLASVYLLALALGFRGQYAEHAGVEALATYQRDLSHLALRSRQLDSEAPVASEPSERPMATARWQRARALWAGVAVLWLVAALGTEIQWRQLAQPVLRTVHTLEQLGNDRPSGRLSVDVP